MPEQTSSGINTPPCPSLDPELVPLMQAIADQVPTISSETLPQLRAFGEAMQREDLSFDGSVDIREESVLGPEGASDVTLTILSPLEADGLLPALFYIHGGGLIMGNRFQYLDDFGKFAADGSAIVISVEYRLAPENPAPAQLDDSYAALRYIADNADGLGIDSNRIVTVGVSAGGGIALGLALAARDWGGPNLAAQVLIAPMLDDRFETPSSRMLDDGPTDYSDCRFMWSAALGDAAGSLDVSPYVAPARADSYAGLPRTYLDTGGSEGFRDEVLTAAMRMSQDGVAVDLHLWAGGGHGFYFAAPAATISRAALTARDEFITRVLRS